MADTTPEVDWETVDAMDDAAIADGVAEGPDAAPFMDDAKEAAVLAQRARKATGLTQAAFARHIGVPLGTVRDWERARHVPDRPAIALLRIIRDAPETTMATLGNAAEPA